MGRGAGPRDFGLWILDVRLGASAGRLADGEAGWAWLSVASRWF